jgi:hypothetical protein
VGQSYIPLRQTDSRTSSDAYTQAVQDLSPSLFRTGTIQELSSDDKRELLLQMQRRFNADAKQLARVTGFSYEEVLQILG